MSIKLDIILLQVFVELIRAKYFRNFNELIVVIVTMEKWLFPEDLSSNVRLIDKVWEVQDNTPLTRTCNRNSTYRGCSRIAGNLPATLDP